MVRIFQASTVPESWAGEVVKAAGWTADRRLHLFLGSEPDQRESGRTIWGGHQSQSIGDEELWSWGHFDFTVIVTDRTTDLFEDLPGYVAWILAHEVGHALLTLQDAILQSVYFFVQYHIPAASQGRISEWHQLPHEQACDSFGRAVAEEVLGAAVFAEQMERLLKLPNSPMGRERIVRLMEMTASKDFGDLMEPLRSLVKPYWVRLRELWIKDQERGPKSYVHGIAPEYLFD